MKHAALVALSVISVTVTSSGQGGLGRGGTPAGPNLESGDYWLQPPRCLSHPVKAPSLSDQEQRLAGSIIWCVDRIEIATDRMVVHVRRELSDFSRAELDYGSDQGNRNMYLRDDRGRRYDSVATGGAARDGGLLKAESRLLGTFVFPAPAAGARSFVFYDDDDGLKLEGLRPDPQFRVNRDRQQSLRDLLSTADRIRFTNSWSGLSPMPSPQTIYTLVKEKQRWVGEATFSIRDRVKTMRLAPDAKTLVEFFDELAGSPLAASEYVPAITHTDDYPNMRFEISAGNRIVVFRTESQGADNVPWAAQFDGQTFTVPTDAPTRALRRLTAGLDMAEQQRLIDELRRGAQRQ